MLDRRAVVDAARDYLRRHPEEVGRAVRGALGLRVGVPIAALRWLAEQLVEDFGERAPELVAVPPGLRLGLDIDKMDTRLRLSVELFITRIDMSDERILFELRLEDMRLDAPGSDKTILSALIRSGALDVSRPGDLIRELPNLPPFVVEARGTRLVLDLLQVPKLRHHPLLRHALALITSFITLHRVETDDGHVDVVFRALPRGGRAAAGTVRDHLLAPGLVQAIQAFGRWQERGLVGPL